LPPESASTLTSTSPPPSRVDLFDRWSCSGPRPRYAEHHARLAHVCGAAEGPASRAVGVGPPKKLASSMATIPRPNCLSAGISWKPSDGLKPSTPSLPFWGQGNWWQPTATVFVCLSRFRGHPICHPLPLVATALLHKRSILLGRRRAGRAARSRRFHHCPGARSRVPPPRIPSGAADRPRAKRSSRFEPSR
jgi:hypothetical protein